MYSEWITFLDTANILGNVVYRNTHGHVRCTDLVCHLLYVPTRYRQPVCYFLNNHNLYRMRTVRATLNWSMCLFGEACYFLAHFLIYKIKATFKFYLFKIFP